MQIKRLHAGQKSFDPTAWRISLIVQPTERTDQKEWISCLQFFRRLVLQKNLAVGLGNDGPTGLRLQ